MTIKTTLSTITLLGVDCLNISRLQAAMDICEKNFEFGAVKLLTSLPTDDSRAIKIPHIGSAEEFSAFCINELKNHVDTDYVLLVQYDGFILHPESWNDSFLDYDYVGAPLTWGGETGLLVGNGGFCLRSKKFLEVSARLAKEGRIAKFHPEDKALCVWYRDLLEAEGIKFASPEVGATFSINEPIEEYGKPFGFHGLYSKNVDALMERYPEFPIEVFLSRLRSKRIEKIVEVFKGVAVAGYLKNEKDVWLLFGAEDLNNILKDKQGYFAKVGTVESCKEGPENVDGCDHASVIYKTRIGTFQIDYHLCLEGTEVGGGKTLFD